MATIKFPAFIFMISFLSALHSSPHAELDDQAFALLAIKTAVAASNPRLSSWNTSSTGGPCVDKWVGVVCDDNSKRITGVNISAFYLEGVVPIDAFSKLTDLKSIDFSDNVLEGPFPSLDNLKSLHNVNFSKNRYGGPFPETLLSLTTLVEIRLANNNFTGPIPETISNLKLLEELWLGGTNTITGPIPKGLASLRNMRILTLWASFLYDTLPPEWGVWVNLTYLNIHKANLHGNLPSEWGANFTKVTQLHLYNNELTGPIPDSWKGMTSLQDFRLMNNYLTGPVPSWISQLPKLNNLSDFSCNYFKGTAPSVLNSSKWNGNCFVSDSRSHDQNCNDHGTCAGGPPHTSAGKRTFPTGAIIGIVLGCIILSGTMFALCYVLRRRSDYIRRRRRRRDEGTENWAVPEGVKRFTYKEISKATKSFHKSCEIGEGGFGKVYLAKLDGKYVAIKRAGDLTYQGMKEFQNEITLLSRLHHRHLVRLEGFCDHREEQILIYEYMTNGNLHFQLFGENAENLNWYRRLEIAAAAAK
ncbi:hypothetical protein KP509_1Z031300 [Ceratopteris richardii]|nr:hypothetical protein KP509_1Z031300 [Ceratopteris richardii]